ncbi:hypothetical protein SPONN_2793 [uncultured Candidatus Thioglobus sp.]|nr:hypothetical protein SPONN_2793 [uncultured Candidatus Thioglobus sp.]
MPVEKIVRREKGEKKTPRLKTASGFLECLLDCSGKQC